MWRTTGAAATDGSIAAEVEQLLDRMFALVAEGLQAATEAFLEGDRDAARAVVAGDRDIDALQAQIERLVERRLSDGRPVDPSGARLLVSVLRIAPELERSGDLIEHIALRTPQRLAQGLTPRGRGLLTEMGTIARKLWHGAASAFADRDASRFDELRVLDDALDDLHVEFTAELAKGRPSVAEAVELGLIARFYERLGDHAVNIARRVRYLTDG